MALSSCLLNSSICSGVNGLFFVFLGGGIFSICRYKSLSTLPRKKAIFMSKFTSSINSLRLRIPEFLECIQTYCCALPFEMSHSLVPRGVDASTKMFSAQVDGGDEAVLMSFSFRHYSKRASMFFVLPCLIKNSDVCFFEQHCYCFIHFKRCLL